MDISANKASFNLNQREERQKEREKSSLTIVGEAGLAQTHEEVHLHLVGGHRLGADGTLEPWKKERCDE